MCMVNLGTSYRYSSNPILLWEAHNTQQSLVFTEFTYNYFFWQSMLLFYCQKKGSPGVLAYMAGLHANCFLGCVLHPANNYITAVFRAESSGLQLCSLTLLGTNTSTAKTNHNPWTEEAAAAAGNMAATLPQQTPEMRQWFSLGLLKQGLPRRDLAFNALFPIIPCGNSYDTPLGCPPLGWLSRPWILQTTSPARPTARHVPGFPRPSH